MRRILSATLLAVGIVAVAAAPAIARDGRERRDSAVSITGRVDVVKGDTIDGPVVSIDGPVSIRGFVDGDVYVAHGNVTVDGRVNGTIVVARGDVKVSGQVDDDITVIDGRATVPGGTVRGDVKSSERPRVSEGGHVTGDVEKLDLSGWFTAIGFALLAYLWIAVSVSLLVVGIVFFAVFPRAGDAIVRVAHTAVGPAIGWAAIIAFGVPIAAGLAISTLVGLPLGLSALLAMGLVFCLGYVMSAAALGRLILKEKSGLVAFLAGFGILRAVAIIPGLGLLVWLLASAYGVGVLAVAAYRGGRASRPEPSEPSRPEPSAPSEPSAPAATPSTPATPSADVDQ